MIDEDQSCCRQHTLGRFAIAVAEFCETIAPKYAEREAMLSAINELRIAISAASESVSYRGVGFYLGDGSPLIVVSREEAVRVLDELMLAFCER